MTISQLTEGKWGRAWEVSPFSLISTILLLITTPFIVLYAYICITYFEGSLFGSFTWEMIPYPTWNAFIIFVVWVGFQMILALYTPDIIHKLFSKYVGGKQHGIITPAGHKLTYEINGLQSWLITHAIFLCFIPYTIIADNWGGLFFVVNIAGYLLAILAYVKAYVSPTYKTDRKFSTRALYDFCMGIELNPRIGKFDFKLFFNGRPGIIAWTLINFSFAAKQYYTYGYVTNSMILVNVLQAIYVIDFFWNEAWYLKTIDICHDHFGWMLAWGDIVWLPYMYTLQAYYLLHNPIQLSDTYALFVLVLGLAGYTIFRLANHQRYRFRLTDGKEKIWGKDPESIPCTYLSGDGKQHTTKLLTSGWWGITRHMNYTGDLILSLSWCLATGFEHILPYFYIVYITILLIHRCYRDEHRCKNKYGSNWDLYCDKVRYRLIPGVF